MPYPARNGPYNQQWKLPFPIGNGTSHGHRSRCGERGKDLWGAWFHCEAVWRSDVCPDVHGDEERLAALNLLGPEWKQKAWWPIKLRCKQTYTLKYTETNYHKACKTRRMWNQWKNLRKWLKTWIMFYFRAQNDPEIGPLRPIFNTPLKVAQSNWHVNKDWCETSGKFLRKRPKTGIFTYFGARSGPCYPHI